jgi:FkbM family methyltransferase
MMIHNWILSGGVVDRATVESIDCLVVDGVCVREGTTDTGMFYRHMKNDSYGELEFLNGGGKTVVDIGANVGAFAVKVAAKGARIFCVEAIAENAKVLAENLRRSSDEYSVLRAAAWRTSGERITLDSGVNAQRRSQFHLTKQSITQSEGSSSTETTESISIGDILAYFDLARCDLMKIDIEGAEYEVLFNLDAGVFERIDRIYLEYHADRFGERNIESLLGLLTENGYECHTKVTVPGIEGFLVAIRQD